MSHETFSGTITSSSFPRRTSRSIAGLSGTRFLEGQGEKKSRWAGGYFHSQVLNERE